MKMMQRHKLLNSVPSSKGVYLVHLSMEQRTAYMIITVRHNKENLMILLF